MEEKILLLGKHVIVNDGDFKGVSGLLKSLDIETDQMVVRDGARNKELASFITQSKINCKIIVNSENIIKVPIEFLSKFN